MKFNQEQIIQKVAPHFGELTRIIKQAHSYFIKQAAITGADYTGVTYAWIMQKNIIDLLSKSYIITKNIGKLVPYFNITLLEIDGFLISFNKINNKKQKSKDIEIQNKIIINENHLKQLRIFSDDNENNDIEVTESAPLTAGYIVKDAKIAETYLTHQIGKTVHWYENMSNFDSITLPFKQLQNTNNIYNRTKRRIKNKNCVNSDNVIELKSSIDN